VLPQVSVTLHRPPELVTVGGLQDGAPSELVASDPDASGGFGAPPSVCPGHWKPIGGGPTPPHPPPPVCIVGNVPGSQQQLAA
jgi:hypothetical protein